MNTSADPDLPSRPRIDLKNKNKIRQKNANKICFKPAHQHDLPQIAKVYMRAYKGMEEYGEPSLKKAYIYLRQLLRICPISFFKAEINGKIAGCVACDPFYKDENELEVMELHEIVVDPAWQGYGLGKKLFRLAQEIGIRMGRQKMSLWAGEGNEQAIDWYTEKFGFVQKYTEGKWIHFCKELNASGFV